MSKLKTALTKEKVTVGYGASKSEVLQYQSALAAFILLCARSIAIALVHNSINRSTHDSSLIFDSTQCEPRGTVGRCCIYTLQALLSTARTASAVQLFRWALQYEFAATFWSW